MRPTPRPAPAASFWRRAGRWCLWGLQGLCATVLGAVGWGALHYQGHSVWAGVWGVLWLALLVLCWTWPAQRKRVWGCGAVALLVMAVWWGSLQPLHDRDWAPDVAHMVQGQVQAGQPHVVTLRHVRAFDWRSETDFTPRWDTRTVDLQQLRSVDMAVSYWMGPAIAHTLVSFGFADGQHLVFSVEIRKERHEQFDALAGFFKQYELSLIAADERDILAVRTNVRGEDVYLYRVHMPQPAMQSLFMAYVRQGDALAQQPRFYHTLIANCTTIVWQLARSVGQGLPLDWRLLASGYLPEYLYSLGALTPGVPLEALRADGRITERAQQWQAPPGSSDAQASADFSRYIRAGLR